MFIPGAGFISAILSIYDTVMVFVNKIKKIIQVVTGFIDSIVAIAAGQIGAAATRVETALAGVLSLAINFLAGFAGLGKVADQVMGVINKIRAPIDKALDWLVNWIVTAAKKLGKFVAQAGVPADPKERLAQGTKTAVGAVDRFAGKTGGGVGWYPRAALLEVLGLAYGFWGFGAARKGRGPRPAPSQRDHIPQARLWGGGADKGVPLPPLTIVDPPKVLVFEFRRFTENQSVTTNDMTEGLQHHQTALNALSVDGWLKNIDLKPTVKKSKTAAARKQGRANLLVELRAEIVKEYAAKGKTLTDRELEFLVKQRSRGRHASHAADFVSGGDMTNFDSLELGSVNSYVGSQWGLKRPVLDAYAGEVKKRYDVKDRGKINMNFRLRIQFLN